MGRRSPHPIAVRADALSAVMAIAMAALDTLHLHHFRNFTDQQWQFVPGINWIIGPNGSGKTSILEAIGILSSGRSFRTHLTDPLVQSGSDTAVIFMQDSARHTFAWEKSPQGIRFQLDGTPVRIAQMAECLPALIFESDLYQIWGEGSWARRRLLNWGIFHAYPEIRYALAAYEQVLKQRNRALKNRCSTEELHSWDQALIQWAEPIHAARLRYWSVWKPIIHACSTQFVQWLNPAMGVPDPLPTLVLDYDPGWDGNQPLQAALAATHTTDRERGHTTRGPHRADIKGTVHGTPISHRLSRGEQKSVGFALQLSQLDVLSTHFGIHPVLLIDDLPSELDGIKQEAIVHWIRNHAKQAILTAVSDPDCLDNTHICWRLAP